MASFRRCSAFIRRVGWRGSSAAWHRSYPTGRFMACRIRTRWPARMARRRSRGWRPVTSRRSALRPEGPYHLLGWSLGGMIAQEMAVQLREAGLDVGVVGLMDAAPLTGEDLSADAAAEATDYAELLGTWRDFFDLEQMEADAEATGDDVLELIRASCGRRR